MSKKIAILVGSLRKDSYNKIVANNIIKLAQSANSYTLIPIGQLPLYNEDLDGDSPNQEFVDFRKTILKYDAILFVTPEYNRSVPAVLKNALDVGSRPLGKSVWNGKPAGIISASPGSIGGFGANHHLRQSLTFLNMPILQQPEMYIGHINKLLDNEGNFIEQSTNDLFINFIKAYEEWIAKF